MIRIFPDYRIRRAEDRLQESYRPVRQPEPPGAPRVHPAHPLQRPLPDGRRVVQYCAQRSSHRLPRAQVSTRSGALYPGYDGRFSRYLKRPVMSGPGLYDPTSIMNADTLNQCQREGWIKLAFYLLSFFYYLYG